MLGRNKSAWSPALNNCISKKKTIRQGTIMILFATLLQMVPYDSGFVLNKMEVEGTGPVSSQCDRVRTILCGSCEAKVIEIVLTDNPPEESDGEVGIS